MTIQEVRDFLKKAGCSECSVCGRIIEIDWHNRPISIDGNLVCQGCVVEAKMPRKKVSGVVPWRPETV